MGAQKDAARHAAPQGAATATLRRAAARGLRGLALAGAALSIAIASAAPAGAPPIAEGPFCAPAPRAWAQSCLDLMDEAERRHADWRAARLTARLTALVEGRRHAAEAVELAYVEAARACAGADRWRDAATMAQRAGGVAAELARRHGRPPRPMAIPQDTCPGRSPTRDREAQAFDAYVRAERVAAVDNALTPQCLVDGPDAPIGYDRAAADRRCAWLAAAGADRAALGARAISQGDDAAAMQAFTQGLSAFDMARESCRGQAGADAVMVRQAILEALAQTRGEAPPGMAEASEIRRPLLEEGGRSLAELLQAQQPRENRPYHCHSLNAGRAPSPQDAPAGSDGVEDLRAESERADLIIEIRLRAASEDQP